MKNNYVFHKGLKLTFVKDKVVKVLFDDGLTKECDLTEIINKIPQLSSLNNQKLFMKGKLDYGDGIVWSDELDLDICYVYDHGEIVENDPDSPIYLIGHQIHEERLKLNLTQKELAKLCRIDQGDLSKIENGLLNPTLSLLVRISKALNKDLNVEIK